jgi:hypothetical protein
MPPHGRKLEETERCIGLAFDAGPEYDEIACGPVFLKNGRVEHIGLKGDDLLISHDCAGRLVAGTTGPLPFSVDLPRVMTISNWPLDVAVRPIAVALP